MTVVLVVVLVIWILKKVVWDDAGLRDGVRAKIKKKMIDGDGE